MQVPMTRISTPVNRRRRAGSWRYGGSPREVVENDVSAVGVAAERSCY
jgi:hypothetical protein